MRYFSFLLFCFLAFPILAQIQDPSISNPENSAGQREIPTLFSKSEIVFNGKTIPKGITLKAQIFYDSLGYRTFWVSNKGKSAILESYFTILENAPSHGLNPQNYGLNELQSQVANAEMQEDLAYLDFKITASFLQYLSHLNRGILNDPGKERFVWVREDNPDAELQFLFKLSRDEGLDSVIDDLMPNHSLYKEISEELNRTLMSEAYTIEKFTFDDPHKVKPGFTDKKISKLRHNLCSRGYNAGCDSLSNTVDIELLSAIALFQTDHDLLADSIPGHRTLKNLNATRDELIDLLSLNLERLRWLPKRFGEDYLFINIPGYRLEIFRNGIQVGEMKVITGDEYHPTPVFSDTLQYIVFRPDWTVPQSIVHEEMIPKLKKDSSYYSRQNFELFEGGEKIDPLKIDWSAPEIEERFFVFVQKPGIHNTLGLVKFIMPNDMSIYLHDTPADYLFDLQNRALSHGCIRISDPVKLAQLLLKDQGDWDTNKIKRALEGEDSKKVFLKDPFHVQISYITVRPGSDGKLTLLEDIYGHDKRQLEELRSYFP